LAIVTPEEDMVIGAYDPIQFAGQVLESSLSVEELRLEWSSDRDGVLYSDAARSNGMVRPDEVQLTTPGEHTVFLRAYRGALLVGETSVVVQVCGWEVDARFVGRQDVEPGRWELWANASLTSEDAVDLTGLGRMRRGGLVYTERPIEVHYTSVDFRFWMGAGSGGDGLALNVIDVDEPEVLRTLLLLGTGGTLGYVYEAPFAGLHVEADTYSNGSVYGDIPSQHVAIARDGDGYNPISAAYVGRLNDQQWHQFTFRIDPYGRARVYVDGVQRLETRMATEDLVRRGYLSFSAATGGSDDAHRVDNIDIRQCRLPKQ
ncbi:MAG: hypothetical protein AAFX99_32870, partial [Myxococcota bacterium]